MPSGVHGKVGLVLPDSLICQGIQETQAALKPSFQTLQILKSLGIKH